VDSGLLGNLSHADLYTMRSKARTQAEQDALAAEEHRAFARESVRENPLMALSLLPAVPLYQLYKATGLSGARSRPSLNQLKSGLLGIKDGLVR
jgi:hypothetical protein